MTTSAKRSRKKDESENESRVMLTMRKKPGESMREYLARTKPSEMSVQEKEIICILTPEAPELPYPTRELPLAYGPATQEYVIPEEKRAEVLKALYFFEKAPEMNEKIYDIHEQKYFTASEYRVIRERGRNILVSPYYPETGGTIVDWIPDDNMYTFVQKLD